MSDPATKDDLENLERRLEKKLDELESWLLDRAVASIRSFVGTQLACVVLVIWAVYFIVQHVR
jgi:hypothetical protein